VGSYKGTRNLTAWETAVAVIKTEKVEEGKETKKKKPNGL
jgi:hypothetical protein